MTLSIFRRIAVFAFSLWAILTIGFLSVYMLPGDPARIILGQQASDETIQQFRHDTGLDTSFGDQYLRYLVRTSKFDFGASIEQRRPVLTLLRERTMPSVALIGCATLITLLTGGGLPLLLSALRIEKFLPYLMQIAQIVAFVPPYALAVFAVILFAGWARIVPVLFDPNSIGSWLMTSAVLAAYPTTLLLRVLLTRLREELETPYARRAAALGFSITNRIFREALPNVLPAALSVLTNNISFFLTGAFFVEVVTGFPGLGRLAQQAISAKDIPVLMGVFFVYAVIILLLSLALDLVQDAIHPRKKFG